VVRTAAARGAGAGRGRGAVPAVLHCALPVEGPRWVRVTSGGRRRRVGLDDVCIDEWLLLLSNLCLVGNNVSPANPQPSCFLVPY